VFNQRMTCYLIQ